MLTSYMVTCPHLGCHWVGSLLPRDNHEAWRHSLPTRSTVLFECPQCHKEWQARVAGDDVIPLPLSEMAGHSN